MKYFIVLFLLLTQTTMIYAADIAIPDDFAKLLQTLAEIVPNSKPDRITPTPITGLFEVVYNTQIFYATKDGRYIIHGDIDCGYCRKFHSEIDSYLKEGIRVRYMSYPRSGVDTPSYYKAVSVWCAKYRKAALTRP